MLLAVGPNKKFVKSRLWLEFGPGILSPKRSVEDVNVNMKTRAGAAFSIKTLCRGDLPVKSAILSL